MLDCIRNAPQPVYAKELADRLGVERGLIDAALDRLRLNGAIELTEWISGKGQGYRPTEEGLAAAHTAAGWTAPLQLRTPTSVAGDESSSEYERGERVRNVFLDPQSKMLWKILIVLNVAVFGFGLVLCERRNIPPGAYLDPRQAGPHLRDVAQVWRDMGSLNLFDLIANHDWWRLITYQFLHGGALHLLSNLLGLYMLGEAVENMWGWKKLLVIYLYSGITGGCFALLFSTGNLVGASAAVYGMLTALGMWVFLNRRYLGSELPGMILRRVRVMLVLMVLMALVPNVSFAGHVGGALAGAVIAIPLNSLSRWGDLRRPVVWLLPFVLLAPLAAVAWELQRHDDVRRQIQVLGEQERMERTDDMLLNVYNEALLPVLRGPKSFEAAAPRAQELLPRAQGVVKAHAAELTARTNASEGELREEYATRVAYLETWGDALAFLQQTLKLPEAERLAAWMDIVRQAVEKIQAISAAREKVLANKILVPPSEWRPMRPRQEKD